MSTNLIIKDELRDLLPELDSVEYAMLEESILREGCTDPIIVWDGIIVDGHNRYRICQDHDVPFETKEISFASMDDAKRWMLVRQMGRRNLTSYHKGELALKYGALFEAEAKDRQREGGKTKLPQNSDKPARERETCRQLAKVAGVSHDTMARIKKISEQADEPTKEKLREGSLSINKAYNELKNAGPQTAMHQVKRTPPDDAESSDLPVGIVNDGGFIRHVECPLPDVPESFSDVYQLMKIASENFLASMELAFANYTAGMSNNENDALVGDIVNGVIDALSDMAFDYIVDEIRDNDPSANPFIGCMGDLPGVKMIGAHGVHVATPLEDKPESFPFVARLLDSVTENYIVSLDNTIRQYTPGIRTPGNDRIIEHKLQQTAQEATRLKRKYIDGQKTTERL